VPRIAWNSIEIQKQIHADFIVLGSNTATFATHGILSATITWIYQNSIYSPCNNIEMLKDIRQLLVVAIYFVLLMLSSFIKADMKVKIFCLGDELKLECPFMNILIVHLTSTSVPAKNSSLCNNGNTFPVPCDLLSYYDWLKKECSGRRACSIGKMTSKKECKVSYIVTVVYECKPTKINSTVRTEIFTKETLQTKSSIHASMRPTGVGNETKDGRKVSSVTCLFYTLFSATVALQYMQGRPKHLILCFVLSISAGIVILMVAVLLMACVEKILEENKRKEDAAVEISLPLLVTPSSNLPATSTQIESAQTSEAGSAQRDTSTLPRIHSIRRCHSVDEGTQTEADASELINVANGLSDNEAKELGYLVDIMRYYNSNLENMPPSNAPFSLKAETPTESGSLSSDIARARTELAYKGPRIVDTSRRRKPCLSSTTYSSSNNSENGDATLFLPSTSQNHVAPRTPCLATLPRRRPYANSKHDAFTHTSNSIHTATTPRLHNATTPSPRARAIGRARFAEENSVFSN